jgi:MbtH protein
MANPFDDETGSFVVLVNDESQRSLWPVSIDAPAGWTVEFGPAERRACLEYVEANWIDMRPRSLVNEVGQAGLAGCQVTA